MSIFDDIVVAMNFTYPHYDSIDFLIDLYKFPRMVFYGPLGSTDDRVISCDTAAGFYAYRIFLDLFKRYTAKGYLLVHDDFFLNRSNFETLDASKVWTQPWRGDRIEHWQWWSTPMGAHALTSAIGTLGYHNHNIQFGYSDLMYIPSKLIEAFTRPLTVYSQHEVFVELAWPNIVSAIVGSSQRHVLNTVDHVLYQHPGRSWQSLYSKRLHGIHPVKWSVTANRADATRLLAHESPMSGRLEPSSIAPPDHCESQQLMATNRAATPAPNLSAQAPARPRILFASYHCIHDPASGAALCTRDLFDLLTSRGWVCGAATGPALDAAHATPLQQQLDGQPKWQVLREQAAGLTYAVCTSTAAGYPVSVFAPDPPATQRAPSPTETQAFRQFLARIVRLFRPDVVLTYGGDAASASAIEVARRAGAKVVFWLHNYSYTSADLFRACDAVIVTSEFARNYYRSTLGIEPVVLPGPFAPKRFLCESRDARFVTFVNPEPAKGVFWFARIAEVLGRTRPDIPLLVVEGRGGVDWLGHCGVNLSSVHSVNRMKNTLDPRQFYQVSKLVLMPSLWREGLPRVAVEALANGIPVLGSGRGGLTEVLQYGGIEMPIPATYTPESQMPPTADEVTSWVAVITQLWDDAAAYRAASEAARIGAARWQPNALLPHWEKFLTELAAEY